MTIGSPPAMRSLLLGLLCAFLLPAIGQAQTADRTGDRLAVIWDREHVDPRATSVSRPTPKSTNQPINQSLPWSRLRHRYVRPEECTRRWRGGEQRLVEKADHRRDEPEQPDELGIEARADGETGRPFTSRQKLFVLQILGRRIVEIETPGHALEALASESAGAPLEGR